VQEYVTGSNTATGKIVFGIFAALAEFERELIA
jgi:DNA invertase Pin-like site-specific DNA recombinase